VLAHVLKKLQLSQEIAGFAVPLCAITLTGN
jgi:hypothetical protein